MLQTYVGVQADVLQSDPINPQTNPMQVTNCNHMTECLVFFGRGILH